MTKKALIIDDEPDVRELIALSLDRIGFDTHTAANLEEAIHLLNNYEFDVCLTDMRLPDGNGVEFVKILQDQWPQLPVAVITAHGNMDAAITAMKNGAFDFVSKPVDLNLLRKLVVQATKLSASGLYAPRETTAQNRSSSDTNNRQNESLKQLSQQDSRNTELDIGRGKLIGSSAPMVELRAMIAKVAKTNAPVWITGESGTGKELIAKLIHENSSRSDYPFVAINCGAIPSELMESEMFGHKKGSFTGAHSDHDGLFKSAEGGTLFLDEVAELPITMQVKLLRAIQERTIRPVGAAEEIQTNVRLLSASHKDLACEVEKGEFRHDLYYRLNVICVKAPSLRDRPGDVPEIAYHILNSTPHSTSPAKAISREVEYQLMRYPFPGNVRELENILERAVAMSDGDQIKVEDLNLQSFDQPLLQPVRIHESTAANEGSERERIEQALDATRWNRKAAAARLGLSYRQLRYRIQQYGIGKDDTGT